MEWVSSFGNWNNESNVSLQYWVSPCCTRFRFVHFDSPQAIADLLPADFKDADSHGKAHDHRDN